MATPILNRIRLAIIAQQWNRPSLVDALTNKAPVFPANGDLSIELLITEDGVNLFDYSEVSDITAEISTRTNPLNQNIVVSQQVLVGSIVTGCTLAAFTAGATTFTQAVQIIIPNAMLQLLMTSGTTNLTLAIYADSTDAVTRRRSLLVMDLQAIDADLPSANPNLPPTFKLGNKMSFLCSDGLTRDMTITQTPNNRWTININQAGYLGAGQTVYSLFCSDNLFRDLTLQFEGGAWTLDVNQAGHS